jgi:predicted transcriptional regulator
MEGMMKTLTLDVANRAEINRRALAAFSGKKQGARLSFASPELLWKVLTAKRWDIIKVMCGQGPLSVREIARRVERDIKAVHGDVTALINVGVLMRSEAGVEFPYDAVKVEFLLQAA